MIKKSFMIVLLSLLLGALGFRSMAQDTATYEGKYRFSYPSSYEIKEGSDFIQLTSGKSNINVYGPTSYARLIGTQTFDDNNAALKFFVDRSGLKAGDVVKDALSGNQLAAINVTLSQRTQSGRAVLVDLKNGRKGVVVFLNGKGEDMAAADMDSLLTSLEYPSDLVDVAMSNPDFTTLVAAAQAAGLVDTLRDGDYTVFAPTNEAFAKALKQLGMTAEEVLANTDVLTQILQYHVVEGKVTSDMLKSGWVTTLSGDQVEVKVDRGQVTVNNAHVITADVAAANGVIHVIDRVLLPPDLEAARLAKQFPTTFKRMTEYKGDFTFKYPTGADEKEGSATVILKSGRANVTVYGPGSYQSLVGNNVIEGDAERLAFFLKRLNAYEVGDAIDPLPENAKAGVNVTVPRFNQSGQAYLVDLQNGRTGVIVALAQRDGYSLAYRDYVAQQALATFAYPADLVDVASSSGDFSILVKAINAAGLTDTLRDKSASFTVFAPTNGAFIKFYTQMKMTEQEVLSKPDLVKAILTYHVLPAAVTSDKIVAGPVDTVYGYPATISIVDDKVMVNDATVTQVDLAAANGVIHVIDKVLVPPLCLASTETKNIGVYLGPSTSRSRIAFLPIGPKVAVMGQAKDADGAIWYMVDPKAAAPGKQVKAIWVLSSDITGDGPSCATVPTVK